MVHGVGTALVLSKPGCWSVNRDRRVVVMFGSSSAFVPFVPPTGRSGRCQSVSRQRA
jgi:hypothetical protein